MSILSSKALTKAATDDSPVCLVLYECFKVALNVRLL